MLAERRGGQRGSRRHLAPPDADLHLGWRGTQEGKHSGEPIKRWSGHLSDVAAGCAFVLGKMTETLDVAEKLGRLLDTPCPCFGAGQAGGYQTQPEDYKQGEKNPVPFVHTL